MSKKYSGYFKKEITKEYVESGKTLQALGKEYKISKSVVRDWVNKYSEECQYTPEKYSLKEKK